MVNLGELVFSIIAEDKASTTVGAAAAKIGQAAAVAGAAVTAFGAGATLLIDRNREMDASFRTTALSMGVPAEAVKELARSLQSVDSPIAEVSASLDILARAGMDNVESMGATASAFDTLADGIGVNADTLTDAMVPAFAALNIELEDAPQYVDGLATTFRKANVDLGDFSQLMTRVGPDLGKMGLGLKDVEVILMALAEKGITGRKAMSELSKAIEESGGSSAALYRSLGITNTELGTYNTKLERSAGAAQEFADAQNSAFGTVDKLGFELDKLGQTAGDLLAPFEGVATAAIAVGPAMTAAGSAASLLDNEMMVKLFPSLGRVVTGITGAGGLVPALGAFTTSIGLTTAGMTSFAVAAAAIAVPLVALVGTCALLGPAIDTAAQAWAGFLGATKDTTAAIEGVEEQYDATTGAVVRYADAQEEAAIIAADASLQYDATTGAVIRYADAQEEAAIIAADASLKYDECTGAIIENADAAKGAILIYDDAGQIIGQMGEDLGAVAVQYDEVTGAVKEIAPAIEAVNPALEEQNSLLEEAARRFGTASKEADGYASSLSTLEIAQRTWNGTQATSFEYYKQGLEAGAPPSPGDYASPEGYMDALKEWQGKVSGGSEKKPGASGSTSSGGSGSAPKTWAGQNDPDYTGGDPEAWRTDARLKNEAATATRNYADAVATVAPTTREATASTRELDTGLVALSSASSSAAAPIQAETTAVTGLGSAAPAAAAGLTYFRDAQGRLTDMVLQAPVPLNAEAAAVTGAGAAASAATPKVAGLNTGIAGTASAASGATGPVSGLGSAVASTGSQATSAAGQINGATSAINGAKAAAASASSVLAATAGNLGSVAASANTAANAFVSMGRQYLTARNSIQSNPITSIHTIKTIVEGGGANVAPGASATKYYPKFHEGGTYQAPAGASEGFAKLLDGERVLSRAETKEYEGGGIAAAVAAGIAKGLAAVGLGGGGDVIVHGDVKLSEDYSYDRFREDVGRWKSSRIAKGVL